MPSPSPVAVAVISEQDRGFRSRWRRFWAPPEQFLLDAGTTGEALIGRIRILLTGVLLLIPISNLVLGPPGQFREHLIGLALTGVAFVSSLGLYILILQDRRQTWLPMATAIFDVTFISLANFTYAFVSDPHVTVNSKVTFDTYFIALGATCLRFDKRVALVAGLVTMAQFGAIVVFVHGAFALQMTPEDTNTFNPYGRFQWSDQISRLILLATATALCVYIVRGIQRQRELSNADPLTGVFNRRFFDDYFASEMDRAARFGSQVSVAMIDVDHFKQFNDRFGHAAGDVVLRRVAEALQQAVRRSDLVARYGGEEFVVLFREAAPEQALELVERIRDTIQTVSHTIGDNRPVHVTVSAGVASWPSEGRSVGDLIATADRRLFEAKEAGRNRVVGAV